jgi:hypothetical protein
VNPCYISLEKRLQFLHKQTEALRVFFRRKGLFFLHKIEVLEPFKLDEIKIFHIVKGSWQNSEFVIVQLQVFYLFDKIKIRILEFQLVEANVKFSKKPTHV